MFRSAGRIITLVLLQWICASAALTQERCSAGILTEFPDYYVHVKNNFADILIARNEYQNAEYNVEKNKAFFDPRVNFDSGSYTEQSFYSGTDNQLSLQKNNRLFGSRIEAGYREGSGNFPIYQDRLKTSDGGEFFTNLTIPLLRNLSVDQERLNLELAELGKEKRLYELFASQQATLQDFTAAILKLLNAQANIDAINGLISNLTKQKSLTKEQIDAGTLPANDALEIERFILKAKNELQNYLFTRKNLLDLVNTVYFSEIENKLAACQLTAKVRLSDSRINGHQDLQDRAFLQRPDLLALNVGQKQISQQLKFARNQLLPDLNFKLNYQNGYGNGSPDDTQHSTRGLLTFDFPLYNRFAKNDQLVIHNNLRNLQLKIENLKNLISNQIFQYAESYRISLTQTELLTAEIDLLKRLLAADYVKYRAGNNDLFQINLRENILLKEQLKLNDIQFGALQSVVSLQLFINDVVEVPALIKANFKK